MPLVGTDQKTFEAATGYAQLSMWLDANEELENLDPFNRASPEVLTLRIEIYRGLKKWDLMREIAKRLNEFQPNEVQWILSLAFATRRAVSIEIAKQILLKSILRFPKEAAIFFNLACYECQQGKLEVAARYLKITFGIEPKWRLEALSDEDLKPLWDSI